MASVGLDRERTQTPGRQSLLLKAPSFGACVRDPVSPVLQICLSSYDDAKEAVMHTKPRLRAALQDKANPLALQVGDNGWHVQAS